MVKEAWSSAAFVPARVVHVRQEVLSMRGVGNDQIIKPKGSGCSLKMTSSLSGEAEDEGMSKKNQEL